MLSPLSLIQQGKVKQVGFGSICLQGNALKLSLLHSS